MNINKKGFTLIELLAVIVVLAILSLITIPIVLNIINGSQKKADLRSLEQYAKAVELRYTDAKYVDLSIGNMSFASFYANVAFYASDSLKEHSKITFTKNDDNTSSKYSISYTGSAVVCDFGSIDSSNKISLSDCYVNDRGPYSYYNGTAQ